VISKFQKLKNLPHLYIADRLWSALLIHSIENTTQTIIMARVPKRRKPRRKRKLVEPTQPSDIPYSKYRIEWCDIISDSGWADEKQFNRMKLAFPVNEGWLFSKDKHHIKVFASYDKDADTKEITFGDRTMIPVSCVKKMIKLN